MAEQDLYQRIRNELKGLYEQARNSGADFVSDGRNEFFIEGDASLSLAILGIIVKEVGAEFMMGVQLNLIIADMEEQIIAFAEESDTQSVQDNLNSFLNIVQSNAERASVLEGVKQSDYMHLIEVSQIHISEAFGKSPKKQPLFQALDNLIDTRDKRLALVAKWELE